MTQQQLPSLEGFQSLSEVEKARIKINENRKERKAKATKCYFARISHEDKEFEEYYQQMLNDKVEISGISINGKPYSF